MSELSSREHQRKFSNSVPSKSTPTEMKNTLMRTKRPDFLTKISSVNSPRMDSEPSLMPIRTLIAISGKTYKPLTTTLPRRVTETSLKVTSLSLLPSVLLTT